MCKVLIGVWLSSGTNLLGLALDMTGDSCVQTECKLWSTESHLCDPLLNPNPTLKPCVPLTHKGYATKGREKSLCAKQPHSDNNTQQSLS